MKIFFVFMYNYIHLNKNEMNINKQQALESFQFNITTVKRFTQQIRVQEKSFLVIKYHSLLISFIEKRNRTV